MEGSATGHSPLPLQQRIQDNADDFSAQICI